MKVYMFHYVKTNSNYYHYDLKQFEKTIKYLKENYKVISLKQFDELKKENKIIPDDYIMLTFDDGTIDHYKNVYPILLKYNCSGLFFIPSCIFNNKVLDVQIIHQLLENNSIDILMNDLISELSDGNIDILNKEKIDNNNSESIFKQLLQYKLPKDIRYKILHYLSTKYKVSLIVEDNYINLYDLKVMKENNMFFGIHTNTHPRLGLLSKSEQVLEIEENMNLLIENGLIDENLCSIAFPFGSFNDETLEIMQEKKIKYGFKVNEEGIESDLLINRIDCNQLKNMIIKE